MNSWIDEQIKSLLWRAGVCDSYENEDLAICLNWESIQSFLVYECEHKPGQKHAQ